MNVLFYFIAFIIGVLIPIIFLSILGLLVMLSRFIKKKFNNRHFVNKFLLISICLLLVSFGFVLKLIIDLL